MRNIIKKVRGCIAFIGIFTCFLSTIAFAAASAQEDTGREIINADKRPQDWLTYGRTYSEQRYSPLDSINERNVDQLKIAWYQDFDTNRGQEGTPLVVDGVLYATTNWSKVRAYKADTGELLWQYDPRVPGDTAVRGCCDTVNRGAAYWNGKIIIGTFDGRLVALNAKTGQPVWEVNTIPQDAQLGDVRSYIVDGAPRVAKGVVIIGNGGAEFGARGFVSGFDAETGKLRWRFFTVPAPDNKPDRAVSDGPLSTLAYKTWGPGNWVKSGGGGTVWDAITYDPQTDLVYIGVGNGSPWNYKLRSGGVGDNLFLGSIVALRPETGEYVWHFQETPQDQWDFTSTQQIMTADILLDGKPRHVVMHAPKNGFFYILDAKTGKFLSAKNYVDVNWAKGVDPQTGRPNTVPEALYSLTGKPWLSFPGDLGGHNWQPMAYSPKTGYVYIPAQQIPFNYVPGTDSNMKSKGLNLGLDMSKIGAPDDAKVKTQFAGLLKGWLIAWDPVKQAPAFTVDHQGPWNGGVLATAGNLVFQGLTNGLFNAYDARTGKQLWQIPLQSAVMAAPIAYAVNGKQYIAVEVGWGGIYPLLMGGMARTGGWTVNKSRLVVFSLDGDKQLPPVNKKGFLPVKPPHDFDAAQAKAGYAHYMDYCAACHGDNGESGGVLPDLRWSGAIRDPDAFYRVVGDGALTAYGMVGFKDAMTPQQIETIRQFLVGRASATYDREVKARENQQQIPGQIIIGPDFSQGGVQ
ncbi:PQQ-dependent dehydrogenase, methanol/ethanol family [Pluralibacter gergoviae]|uniref:PQQ-dependent dehydrogenase, methanol/ethanol family n=1 Tax=Pluralibacter gergoviae TaxID=61647 RepID=UPI0009BAD700|nr:PQQ-dependent dehydrogenase, methanol/ethanol family [Pluralibacter gergoviae]